MILIRNLGRMVLGLFLYAARSGRWWVPALAAIWIVVAALVIVAKVVVPTAVYTLF